MDIDVILALGTSAKDLRERAEKADARAFAAERDRDIADAAKWRQKALDYRRMARDREYAE